MYDKFEEFTIQVSPDIQIYGRTGGTGPPLVLIHGYPQNHRMWHLVAPKLAEKYTLIIPDLRGYGRSSHPKGEEDHSNYSKRAMASDVLAVAKHLGHSQFAVCGHDRGGRVAHRLAVDHPEAVTRVMVLDIAPTLAMFESTDFNFARAYFHWFFLAQPSPMPETLISASADTFFEEVTLMKGLEFSQEVASTYRDQLADYDTCHAMCEDYRAAATVDLEHAREDIKEGRKVKCPLRCVWGKQGVVEKLFDPLKLWGDVCERPVDGEAVQSGHFIPEHAPEDTIRHVTEFFV